jgi:U3 small nucleolar ribonucleoprotein protein LCP5
MDNEVQQTEVNKVLDEMTTSISAARTVVKELIKRWEQFLNYTGLLINVEYLRNSNSEFDTKDGISLLSMKCHLMLSYLHSLSLLGAHRVLGHAFSEHEPPTLNFSESQREIRGAHSGDLVDAMVEDRVVLEKIKAMESRMKYQIDKLLRMADEESKPITDVTDGMYSFQDGVKMVLFTFATFVPDPLAFRPNPANFVEDAGSMSEGSAGGEEATGVYKPPRVAPVPYIESRGKEKVRKGPVPIALSSLQHIDSSTPYTEKSSGLSVSSTLASARARELQRITEFEEENMTRLVMNKKEMNRRKRDEADIALGGTGIGIRGRQRGGLEDEFRDILQSVGKSRTAPSGDGYEELRKQGKRKGMYERAKGHSAETLNDSGGNPRKKARFEQEVRRSKKKSQSRG